MTNRARSFRAVLDTVGPGILRNHIAIPFSVERTWGSRARVPVAGTLNGVAFRSSVMPCGDGTHAMPVGKAMQAEANCKPGDIVRITMAVDPVERRVQVPAALADALRLDPEAQAIFQALSFSRQKEYANWIDHAKREQTRTARAQRSVTRLLHGERWG